MTDATDAIDYEFPEWAQGLFKPWRYKCAYGGRGSSKSWTFARGLIASARARPERILCAREIQKSIKDSVHQLLVDQIKAMRLEGEFNITDNEITGWKQDSLFIFAGLRANVEQIKSMEGITKVWVEEAEKVSKKSWKILTPTIRRPGSEIWVTFNPDDENDPTSQMFIVKPVPNAWIVKVNHDQNPWFPRTLRREMEYDYQVDPDSADWVWGGNFRKISNAVILAGKWVEEPFEGGGHLVGPLFGADFGFAMDPATLVKVWMSPAMDELWIEHEAYAVGVGNNDMAALYRTVPEALLTVRLNDQIVPAPQQHVIRGDCSRPETINHLCGFGLNMVGCKKWPGSVEDGVAWLRGLKRIVIHPRCRHAVAEAKAYKYKVDPVTNDVQPVIVDKHNHIWDAVRYAVEPFLLQTREHVFSVDAHQEPMASELDDFEAYESGLGAWG